MFSHLKKIQIFQNKVLRIIADAPRLVRNTKLHKDFQIQEIQEYIKILAKTVHSSFLSSTGLMYYNLQAQILQRLLKRRRPV